MEKNPLFTKEKADFIFNRIQKYYDRQAYRQALAEIDENRELLGAVLNMGSQMRLNKITLKSVVYCMLDSFEVDGDLQRFNSLFAQHKTLLELHTDHKTYELLHKYRLERESNPNFKSKTEHYSKTVPYDNEIFPDEGVVQMSIKTSSKKTERAKDIEQDFLNAIEKPSFQYGHLTEEEMRIPTEVIRSDVNVQAIHEDFFSSIRAPKIAHKGKDPDEKFKQIRIDEISSESQKDGSDRSDSSDLEHTQIFTPLNLKEEEKRPAPTDTPTKKKNVVIEPISIEGTVLEKAAPSAADELREKIQHLESKLNENEAEKKGKKEKKKRSSQPHATETEKPSCVKERREITENGQKRTETIHKSGGRITEIVIEGYGSSESTKKKASGDKKSAAPEYSRRKKEANHSKKTPSQKSTSSKASSSSKKTTTAPKKGGFEKFIPIAVLLIVALLLFGGYRLFGNRKPPSDTEPAPITEPSDNTPAEPSENDDTAADNTQTIDETPEYLLPSNERKLTDEDLSGMSKSDVRYAINEMFARYGWHFSGSGELFDYFSQKSWYQPDMSMASANVAEQKFTEIERENLQILLRKIATLQ